MGMAGRDLDHVQSFWPNGSSCPYTFCSGWCGRGPSSFSLDLPCSAQNGVSRGRGLAVCDRDAPDRVLAAHLSLRGNAIHGRGRHSGAFKPVPDFTKR